MTTSIILKSENKTLESISLKYRYLKNSEAKLTEYPSYIETPRDLVYWIDSKYLKNPNEFEKSVPEKEQAFEKAIYAVEVAKQKDLEAKKALQSAKELQNKANQIK